MGSFHYHYLVKLSEEQRRWLEVYRIAGMRGVHRCPPSSKHMCREARDITRSSETGRTVPMLLRAKHYKAALPSPAGPFRALTKASPG